ncbi:MAG: F0F1 ATP synthase subunit epsilon [Spirochaetia bacterium]
MKLRVLVPQKILIEQNAEKITADSLHGVFTILEHHIDCACLLSPGVIIIKNGDKETFIANDEGVLLKNGEVVNVSVRRGIICDSLDNIDELVEQEFLERSETQKKLQTALTRLEINFTKQLIEMKK